MVGVAGESVTTHLSAWIVCVAHAQSVLPELESVAEAPNNLHELNFELLYWIESFATPAGDTWPEFALQPIALFCAAESPYPT